MEPKPKGGRPKGSDYPHKVFSYLDDEGLSLLEALTRKRGLSKAALIRVLILEEAERQSLRDGAE